MSLDGEPAGHSLVRRVPGLEALDAVWAAIAAAVPVDAGPDGKWWIVRTGDVTGGPHAAQIREAERRRRPEGDAGLRAVGLVHLDGVELVLIADRSLLRFCCLAALGNAAAGEPAAATGTWSAHWDPAGHGPSRAPQPVARQAKPWESAVSAPVPVADPADLVAATGMLCAEVLRQDEIVVAVETPDAQVALFSVSRDGIPAPAADAAEPTAGIVVTSSPPEEYLPFLVPPYAVTVACHRDSDGTSRLRTWVDTASVDQGEGGVIVTQLARLAAGGTGYPFVLEPAEIAAIRRAGQGATLPARPPGALHDAVLEVAGRQPDRVAISDGTITLTYHRLAQLSEIVAAGLIELGVKPGDQVGVCMERTANAVVALLAVLRAGACYVPLDLTHPAARRAYIAGDVGLRAVIVDDAEIDGLSEVECVSFPELARCPEPAVLPQVDPDQPAYIIYTSGTTGQPKGAVVPHRNVLALIAATRDEFGLAPSDVWTVFHSLAFDFSVWEIWGGLLTGGRLVMVSHWTARTPARFARLLRDEQVTVLSQTPSAFSTLGPAVLADPEPVEARLVVFGGEALRMPMLAGWLDRYPVTGCRLVNMYGITETTVHVTWHDVTGADVTSHSRSVGRALPGWSVSVRSAQGRLLPFHVAGEICVGGAGLALGYHRRPVPTAQRFPSDQDTGERYYRSGDLGRLRPDGTLEHLGRLDDQIKIRGYRVELGEIRMALLSNPAVKDAAVTFREDDGGAILAYIVAARTISGAEVRRHLARSLPDYMVPAVLHTVAALPLTTNGKVDFDELAAVTGDGAPPPGTPPPTPRRRPRAQDPQPAGRGGARLVPDVR